MTIGSHGVDLPRSALARASFGFLSDRLWWLAGASGLALCMGLLAVLPGPMARSALHGAGAWLSCVLWQPILEEVIFRGIVQGELLRTRWGSRCRFGLSTANVVCSVAFTALHFLHHPPLWAAGVFVPSLLFGWLRERHHGVGAPLGLHMLFNLEFFAAAALALG